MPTQVPPSRLDSTKDFSSLVPSVFTKANAAFETANAVYNSANTSKYITMNQPGSITPPLTGTARYYPKSNITVSNVYAYLGTGTVYNNSTVFRTQLVYIKAS